MLTTAVGGGDGGAGCREGDTKYVVVGVVEATTCSVANVKTPTGKF